MLKQTNVVFDCGFSAMFDADAVSKCNAYHGRQVGAYEADSEGKYFYRVFAPKEPLDFAEMLQDYFSN